MSHKENDGQNETSVSASSVCDARKAEDGEKNPGELSNGEDLAWEEIRTEHIIQDEWIDFRRSAYRFPDGKVYEPFYSYSRRDYVVIVASDEEGRFLCVRQFRQGIRKVTTEFPAGGIEGDDQEERRGDSQGCGLSAPEAALAAAERELLEETGYRSEDWQYLLSVPSNATIADNYAHIFASRNCRKCSAQSLDETEFLKVRKYSADEMEALIRRGEFQQAIHIMAWLLTRRGAGICHFY